MYPDNNPDAASSAALEQAAATAEKDPTEHDPLKRLQALRNSPGFALINNSTLLLKACQLDMDYPPPLRTYVREQLRALLQQTTGKALSPDKLAIRFKTDTHPEVSDQGRERYSRRLSLTDIGVMSLNGPMISALAQCRFTDQALDKSSPALTASVAMDLILNARLHIDYVARMQRFWRKHRDTYRALAKVSFLDTLARQYARKQIGREGYELTLDALGLKDFPTSAMALQATISGTRCAVSLLSVNDQLIPGAFQLKSRTTSHCFIHLPASRQAPVEYISDDPVHMTRRLIEALNNTDAFAHLPDITQPEAAVLSMIEGDVFSAITQAQENLTLEYLENQAGLTVQPQPLKALGRSLALLGAVDLWHSQPGIIDRLPSPRHEAANIMSRFLRDTYGQTVDPDKVFIRYLRGHSIRPLGSVQHAASDFRVPDSTPISLSEALTINYRVASPSGYIDHGGRTVVYLDPTGTGQWSAEKELAVDPMHIEKQIRAIDFLTLMTTHIDEFWEQHKAAIEDALQAHFITQALLCLKSENLQRTGLDLIVAALDELHLAPDQKHVTWSMPGFFLQHSLLDAPAPQYCPSLLVLRVPGNPRRVLYQAGMLRAFAEFSDEAQLKLYLQKAARSQAWRDLALSYVPLRHRERLTYILKVWSGEQAPSEPVSVLRPWTDVLLNHDAHIAMAQHLITQPFTGSPFDGIRRMLKQNSLWDAEDSIVTSREVSLRYWTDRLNHLQLLVAPMSLLLTPALLASLATELGITALTFASANLPGSRYAHQQQALLALLSVALLQLLPSTPRLAMALRKLTASVKKPVRSLTVATASTRPKALLAQTRATRNTRLEPFFNSTTMLKTWSVAGHPGFSTLAIKAWKLRRQFLLWTAEHRQARTLVVSSHGYYLPWSKNARIPNGSELHVYAPHGHELIDPSLHRVVSRKVAQFATLDTQANAPGSAMSQPYVLTDKLLAGTSQPGMIKNYSLSKFQSDQYESYRDISNIVRNSNQSPAMNALPPVPMDVLTIRNRFGMPTPTLEQLFNTLQGSGIHYDRILLLHCRCSAFKSLLGIAPVYKAP